MPTITATPRHSRSAWFVPLVLFVNFAGGRLHGQRDLPIPAMYTFCDIADDELGLINIKTDQLIQIKVKRLSGWPYKRASEILQHSWVTPDGNTIYLSIIATEKKSDAAIAALKYTGIDWDRGKINGLRVEHVLVLDPAGTLSKFADVKETVPEQPIQDWTFPAYTQIHGPTFRPKTDFSYCGTWTDDQMVVFDTKQNDFVAEDTFRFPGFSDFSHGFFFNNEGSLALGAGYSWDRISVELYSFHTVSAEPMSVSSIPLKSASDVGYGAFTHYVSWLDNRYAYTATMQFARTSNTPKNIKIDSPGIYLIDTKTLSAMRIVGTATDSSEAGVFRSASDLVIANHKVYVAEEDTLDDVFGNDGHVAIYEIRGKKKLHFIKRLSPGKGLPSDFAVAHGASVSRDESYVFVASYASNYIVKIDTSTDQVAKVWNETDGLHAPHGGFIVGNYR